MFSHLSKLNKQTDLKEQHNFTLLLLCLYMADPATSLASNGLLGILIFLLRNSLFMQSRKNSHLTTNPVKWEQAENLLTIFAFRAVWLILFWADLRSVSVTRSFVSLPSASLVSPVCDLHALHAAVHTSDHDHALSTIKNTFVHVVVTLSLDFILHWFYQKAVLFFFPLLRSERLWCCWMRLRPSFSSCFIITPPSAITSSFRSCLAGRLFVLRLQNVPNRQRRLNFIAIFFFVLFYLFLLFPGIQSLTFA